MQRDLTEEKHPMDRFEWQEEPIVRIEARDCDPHNACEALRYEILSQIATEIHREAVRAAVMFGISPVTIPLSEAWWRRKQDS